MPGESPEFAGGGGALGFARGAHTGGEEPANLEFKCLSMSLFFKYNYPNGNRAKKLI